MDRANLGRGYPGSRSNVGEASDDGFLSSSPPFPSFDLPSAPASGKPSAAAGLSKPRFAKMRKQFSSPRVRPAVIADPDDGSGLSLFRSRMSAAPSDVLERNEDGGRQRPGEMQLGREPFDPKVRAMVSEGSELGGFGNLKHQIDAGGFIFGIGMNKRSVAEQSMGEQAVKLGSVDYESESTAGSLGHDIFVVGHAAGARGRFKESASSVRNPQEVFFVPNSDNSAAVKSGSSRFVFGTGSLSSSSREHIGTQYVPGNPAGSISMDGVKKSPTPHLTSAMGSGNPDSDGLGKSDWSLFQFELISDLRNNSSDKVSGEKSSFSYQRSMGSHSSGLNKSDHMNWNKPEDAFAFGTSSVDNNFNDSYSMNTIGPMGDFSGDKNDISQANACLFGSGVRITSNSSEHSFYTSDKHSLSGLYDKMGKLNLQYSDDEGRGTKAKGRKKHSIHSSFLGGNAVNALSEDIKKVSIASTQSESAKNSIGNSFLFANNKTALSASGGSAVNTLSEEMNKVSIGSGISSQNATNRSRDSSEDLFIFGSHVSKGSTSDNMSIMDEKNFSSEVLNDIQNLNIGDSKVDERSSRSKNADPLSHLSNMADVLDDSAYAGYRFEGISTLQEDIKKLDIGDTTESSDGNDGRGIDALPNAYSPLKHVLKASKKEQVSVIDDIPTSEVHGDVRPREFAHPSYFMPTPDHGTMSAETGLYFTTTHEEVGTTNMEFTSPKSVDEVSKDSFFAGPRQNMSFSGRKGEAKGLRTKKRSGKPRHFIPLHQTFAQTFASVENMLERNDPDSPNGYACMDYSPYQENLADQSLRETSVPSDESYSLASPSAASDTHTSIHADESDYLVSATQRLDISENDVPLDPDCNDSKDHFDREFGLKSSDDERKYEPDKENFVFNSENQYLACGSSGVSMDSFCSEPKSQSSELGTNFTFASSSETSFGSNFTFGAPSIVQGPILASKHHQRRKCRVKFGHEMFNPDLNTNVPLGSSLANILPVPSSSLPPDPARDFKSMLSGTRSVDSCRAEAGAQLETKEDIMDIGYERVVEEETCEKWRLRGNQAYANGLLLKAEDYYTRGVNSVCQKENSQNCCRALMLCYSNRAAARMSLGKMREALNDCLLALAIDSQFLRALVRAANCHLALGEIDEAMNYFNKCLLSEHEGSVDPKILVDATDGLQKAQKIANMVANIEKLLLKRTTNELEKALQMISESLLICTHSETLMEMRAKALLMLRRHEDVIKFCEETTETAEKSVMSSGTNVQPSKTFETEGLEDIPARLWRWHLMSRANFCLGRLEGALELLKKYDQVKSIVDKNSIGSSESPSQLLVTIRELLRLKSAGNEAFREARHLDAIKNYNAALALNTESRPFLAICLCNRAAAYQALGQLTDAIADCSLAIALDPNYPKALSRRAALHERIRDYEQASNDLRRLISLLEKQIKDKDNQFGVNNTDLCQARLRLSVVDEEARKDIPLDMYLILGIEPSSSTAEVKKAYRKAALRHHPDKAGQLLARSENLEDGLWREVADEVHRDADRLFKMIGEAYTLLSDPERYKLTRF